MTGDQHALDRADALLAFLTGIGLERYFEPLRANDIDLDLLPDLSDADLKEIGIASLGHRRLLRREVDARAEAHDPAPAMEQRKRQVTVMFVDLADYTGLSHRFTSEEMLKVLEAFFQAADPTIRAFGGKVETHIGDCTVGIFGLEDASGREALKALAAAERIHDLVAEPIAALGLTLGVHIGIASGQVVMQEGGDGEAAYAITGNSINLASRLADEAATGETLITNHIYRSVADAVDCTTPRRLTVKGFPEPVPVRRFLGLAEPTAQGGVFVGRERELSILEAAFDRLAEGQGALGVIEGEAGIGKSTLATCFLDRVQDRAAIVRTLVLDFGGSQKTHPVQDIANALVARLGDEARTTGAAIERLAERGLVNSPTRLMLCLLCGLEVPADLRPAHAALDARARHSGMRDALERLVALNTGRGPLVILIEDLHWADPQTLDAVGALGVLTRDLPILLLTTSRTTDYPIHRRLADERGLTEATHLQLDRLDASAAQALAERLDSGASADQMQRCIDRAQGNPLFLRQLLAHVEDGPAGALPDSIQSIIQSRVDQVPAGERRLLEAASVLGQRFTFDAVKWVSGLDTVHLAPLIQAGLVQRHGGDFLFGHALIRDCVYDLIVAARRTAYHRKAAEWFREFDPDLYAEHLEYAGDPAAPKAYLAAARALRSVAHFEAALRHVDRALNLQPDEDTGWALRLLHADLLLDSGQAAEALGAYGTARAAAPDDRARCQAMIGQIGAMRVVDRIDEAHGVLDEAQALAEAGQLDAELSQIHYFRGALYFPAGNIEGCLAEHRQAAVYAGRAGSVEQKCRALSGMGDAHYASGRMRTAHTVFAECLDLARANGLAQIEAANLFMLGTVRIYLNETRAALTDALDAIAIAEKASAHRAEIVSRLTAGWILISMNDLDAARQQVEAGLAVAGQIGARRFEPFLSESLARVLFLKDDRSAAEEVIAGAVAQMRDGAQKFIGPWLLGTQARITTDADLRAACLNEGAELLAQGCVGHNYFRFHQAGIATGLDLGDTDMTRAHADALERYTAPEPVPWSDFHIRRARVMADVLDGKGDEAAIDALARTADEAGLGLSLSLDRRFREMLHSAGRKS